MIATWNGNSLSKEQLFQILSSDQFLQLHKIKPSLLFPSLIGYYNGSPVIRHISANQYRLVLQEFRQRTMDDLSNNSILGQPKSQS